MSETDLDPTSLDKSMPQSAQDAIMVLLKSWVLFEVALTDWLVAVTGMRDDIGILVVGRMDTRGKIDKLKEIYSHIRDARQVAGLKNLGKSNEGYSKIRNTVVHNIYLGHRPRPDDRGQYDLIYSIHRPSKTRIDGMDAVIIRLDDLKKAAKFAVSAAKDIRTALEQARRA
jgi:hypothetical protein